MISAKRRWPNTLLSWRMPRQKRDVSLPPGCKDMKNTRSSRAVLRGVFISLPGKQFRVGFCHDQAKANPRLWVLATEYDEEVREFFGEHGVSFQRHCYGALALYQVSPVPSDAAPLVELVKTLFREVCGVKEDDPLTFSTDQICKGV